MNRLTILGLAAATAAQALALASLPSRMVEAPMRKASMKAPEKKGYALYENFSGWDGKQNEWAPEGWSIEHKGQCSKEYSWMAFMPNEYYPAPIDGDYCIALEGTTSRQDEWLISPFFTPAANMELSFHMYLYPMYFYATENLDWITKEYTGGKKTVYTIQVLIQEEGKDWQTLRDYAEHYMDHSYNEMRAESSRTSLPKQIISLNDYADKNVRIAFRYLGADGDNAIIDAIGVGYPTLDNVWYMHPASTLYWGFSQNCYFQKMPFDIALHPVNAPITWTNMSEEDADYTWRLGDTEDGYEVIANDGEELTVSYSPKRPGAIPTLYESPTLLASAPERIDAEYLSPIEIFQTGGAATYTSDGTKMDFTLFQFPLNYQDVGFKDVRDGKLGAYSIPVFGYNEFSDDYWLNYSLNGQEPMEGNYSHLIGIGNVFFASYDAPLVVNGISAYGWGRIGDDVELTATIYALDEEMHTDFNTFTVIARSKITGRDIQAIDGTGYKDYIYLPFHFDTPATVRASDEHPAFLIMIEGFHSEQVDYFAPLQSHRPNDSGWCAGYILNEINLQGHTEFGPYRSLKTMQYVEDGEYKSFAGTFAIGLNAEYPWLTTKAESIDMSASDAPVEVMLDSYYDGSELKVDTPKGIKATAKGQYDECVLTVMKEADAESGDIRISIHGLELTIPVNTGSNSVAGIASEKNAVAIYDLSGRKVSSPTTGVYVVEYSDGSMKKLVVN